jgi:hypothetical protein
VVSPAALVPWLAEADIERIVFGPKGRVIDVGRRRRLFRGADRRAILVRDRTCYHPYCDEPAVNCEADHIQPNSCDGDTLQDNGRPACGFHNRLRNRSP